MTVTATTEGDYLLVLNAPAAASHVRGHGGLYRIVIDGSVGAGAIATTGLDNTWTPFAVFDRAKLTAGTHTIKAQWKRTSSAGAASLQRPEPLKLYALRMPGGITATTLPSAGSGLGPGGSFEDMGIPPMRHVSKGGDHLFILNATDTWCSGIITPSVGAWVNFRLSVDGEVLSPGGAALYSCIPEVRVPFTIVAVAKNLSAGPHEVAGEWQVAGQGCSAYQGEGFPTRILGVAP